MDESTPAKGPSEKSSEGIVAFPPHNITVLGAFNAAILRPPWVLANVMSSVPALTGAVNLLLPDDEGPAVCVLGDPNQPSFAWFATRQKMVVYGEPSQTSAFVARVLEILSHTPIRAAGMNFQFHRDAAQWWRDDLQRGSERVSAAMRGDLQTWSRSWSAVRDDVLTTFTTKTGPKARALVFDFNFHRDSDDTTVLRSHVARCAEYNAEAKRILGELTDDA